MKFLIKIEEAIDQLILSFVEKTKHATPHFVYRGIGWIKHSPVFIKEKIQLYLPKVKAVLGGFFGIITQNITMARGHVVGFLIYVRSEDFKKKNKKELFIAPFRTIKNEPIKVMSVILVTTIFSGSGYFIYKNTAKIIIGTKALRNPASHDDEEPIVEFKKLKYTVLQEQEIFLDVTIIAKSVEERDKLLPIEDDIKEHLLGINIHVTQLPLSHVEIEAIATEIKSKVTEAQIRNVEVKQVLEGRPKYFMQTDKQISFKDLNLQLFLEDTKRNRQVWVDFTVLSSNRNIILFLRDHEVEVRDFINMHVEPVIPQLPIEEEGRQIIKEKIKLELNEFIKNSGVEGKLLEIYVDYIIVS